MMNLRNRLAGLAGLLVLTSTAAFAQSEMKVDVPFTFHTPTATLDPGTYTISHVLYAGSSPIYRLRHGETGKSVLVIAPTRVERKATEQKYDAKVEFRCAGEYCALATIYSLTKPAGDALPVSLKNAPRGEKVAAVIIPARP